jgi:hypothetical protein
LLPESEIREQARYCWCVLLQLRWLHANDMIPPADYPLYLAKSSLELAGDEFLVATVEEAIAQGDPDGGLDTLIALYEGIVLAFCSVLELNMEELSADISPDELRRLAAEVGKNIEI